MNETSINTIIRGLLVIALVLVAFSADAQRRVRLKDADELRAGTRDNVQYQRLIGNVVFTHNETTIYCDSAHFYRRENSLEAFGNVRIVEGDSITITGNRLIY